MILKQKDEDYFSLGEIKKDSPSKLVMSSSLIKKMWATSVYSVICLDEEEEISPSLQHSFNIGSATHCMILEPKEFDARYNLDISKSDDSRIPIDPIDIEFTKEAIKRIKKISPDLLDGKDTELSIIFKYNSIPCKMKADKIEDFGNKIVIHDLKTTYENLNKIEKDSSGRPWKLIRDMKDKGYDIQAYFYMQGVEAELREQGRSAEVEFIFTFVSTETGKVIQAKVGEELYESGKSKVEAVMSDVYSFIHHGIDAVQKELIC